MMNLHEDVILDLLPAYFAGESSAATREIVDAYFEAHPQFAASVRGAELNVPQIPGSASAHSGHAAINRVKSQLKWRAALIAVGIFCSISPFTFIYANDKLEYFMWRDAPMTAALYAGVAAFAWIALWLTVRRTNTR